MHLNYIYWVTKVWWVGREGWRGNGWRMSSGHLRFLCAEISLCKTGSSVNSVPFTTQGRCAPPGKVGFAHLCFYLAMDIPIEYTSSSSPKMRMVLALLYFFSKLSDHKNHHICLARESKWEANLHSFLIRSPPCGKDTKNNVRRMDFRAQKGSQNLRRDAELSNATLLLLLPASTPCFRVDR